jgi:hypothetical protein
MNRHLAVSVSFLLSMALVAPTVRAQDSASADEREVKAYRLTMEKINQMTAATKSLRKLAATDPKACAAVERDEENQGGSLNKQAKRIETAYPKVIPVLKAHGLTVREYLLITGAQLQAGAVLFLKEATKMKELPPSVNRENVAFMEEHKKELDAITRELGKVPDPCDQGDPVADSEDAQAEHHSPRPATRTSTYLHLNSHSSADRILVGDASDFRPIIRPGRPGPRLRNSCRIY